MPVFQPEKNNIVNDRIKVEAENIQEAVELYLQGKEFQYKIMDENRAIILSGEGCIDLVKQY